MCGVKNDMFGVKNDMLRVKNDMFGLCCDIFAQVGGAGRGGITPPPWGTPGEGFGRGKDSSLERLYKKAILEFISRKDFRKDI